MSCQWQQADSRARPSTLYAMLRPGLITFSTLAAVQQKSCVFGPIFPRRSCRHQERPRARRRRARARRQQGRGAHLLKGERALPGRAPVGGHAGLARLKRAPVRGGGHREVQARRRPAHRGACERAAHPARAWRALRTPCSAQRARELARSSSLARGQTGGEGMYASQQIPHAFCSKLLTWPGTKSMSGYTQQKSSVRTAWGRGGPRCRPGPGTHVCGRARRARVLLLRRPTCTARRPPARGQVVTGAPCPT